MTCYERCVPSTGRLTERKSALFQTGIERARICRRAYNGNINGALNRPHLWTHRYRPFSNRHVCGCEGMTRCAIIKERIMRSHIHVYIDHTELCDHACTVSKGNAREDQCCAGSMYELRSPPLGCRSSTGQSSIGLPPLKHKATHTILLAIRRDDNKQ